MYAKRFVQLETVGGMLAVRCDVLKCISWTMRANFATQTLPPQNPSFASRLVIGRKIRSKLLHFHDTTMYHAWWPMID